MSKHQAANVAGRCARWHLGHGETSHRWHALVAIQRRATNCSLLVQIRHVFIVSDTTQQSRMASLPQDQLMILLCEWLSCLCQCSPAIGPRDHMGSVLEATIVRSPNVDDVVRELRELYHHRGFDLAFAVGGLILERIYDGDLDAWRSRGRKDTSF